MPKGWVWTSLGEIFLHNTGKALNASDCEGTLLSYITTSNLYWDRFDVSTVKEMHFAEDEIDKCTVKKGDLLVCEGGDIGRAAIWNQEYNIRIQNHIHRLRGLGDICQRLFMFWLMFMKNEGMIGGKGIGLMGLSSRELDKMMMPLPPINEEKSIVDKIDILFNVVDALDNEKDSLSTQISETKAKILDLAIHGKLAPQDPSDEPAIELLKRINPSFTPSHNLHYVGDVPNGWIAVTYNDVAEYINGRAFKPEEWESNGLPIIRIQNLNEPSAPFNYSNNRFEKKYQVQKGDLLFAWAASLGVYIWKGQNAWLNQHIFKVIPYPFIEKEYLYHALSASINDFYQKSHGSGMVHITRKQFVNMPLLLPPIDEQKRIIKAIKAYYNILDEIVADLNH